MLPEPEEEVARQLTDFEKRLSSLERLEGPGAWTLIEDIDLVADQADADFQNIPADFDHLAVVLLVRTVRVAIQDSLVSEFNADAGNNYAWIQSRIDSTGHAVSANIATTFLFPSDVPGATAPAGAYAAGIVWIADYLGTSHHKVMLADVGFVEAYAAGGVRRYNTSSFWKNTAAITQVRFFSFFGLNLAAGSRFSLYGISA